jgi:hypothetical protein
MKSRRTDQRTEADLWGVIQADFLFGDKPVKVDYFGVGDHAFEKPLPSLARRKENWPYSQDFATMLVPEGAVRLSWH